MPVRLVVFLVGLLTCGELFLASAFPESSWIYLTIAGIQFILLTLVVAIWSRSEYLESDKEFQYKCEHCGNRYKKHQDGRKEER